MNRQIINHPASDGGNQRRFTGLASWLHQGRRSDLRPKNRNPNLMNMKIKTFSSILLAAALGCFALRANADNHSLDQKIAHELERRLQADPAVDANQIDISVNHGRVTLKGKVDHGVAESRALLLAHGMSRVTQVKDQLSIRQSDRSDVLLEADAIVALADDAATDAFDISLSVEQGVATVRGAVQSHAERELVRHVVGTVKGIRDVVDQLEIDHKHDRPDSELQADIQGMLKLRNLPVKVTVKDREATLKGAVRNLLEKQMAYHLARPLGITAVDATRVKVDGNAEPMTSNVDRSDEAIAEEVTGRLRLNPRIYPFKPKVAVKHGVVTLTGRVDHLKAQREATEEALAVDGVARVFNYLKLRPEPVSGPDVAEKALDALKRHPLVDSSTMAVTSRGSIVILRGTADSSYEKSAAEDVISKLKGVSRVQNQLTVSDQEKPVYRRNAYRWYPNANFYNDYGNAAAAGSKNDWEIKQDIRSELYWSPFVHDDIKVTVEDGVATLTGAVEDWGAYRAAIENAKEGGARRVRANLQVVERDE